MRFVLFVLGLLTCFVHGARAQPQQVVATCGSVTFAAGSGVNGTIDTTGKTCVNASVTVTVAALTSTNLSGTIAVTNTFQSIQALTAGRKGCLIQNNSARNMYVFFGTMASATLTNTYILAAGTSISCAVGGLGVSTDQVSITGTATDAYFANFQ